MIEINVYEKRWYTSSKNICNFIKQVILSIPQVKNKKLSIMLANDQYIQVLNKQYRQQDKPTNVLSFQYDNFFDDTIGDIILSLETIKKEAQEANIHFKEHVAHMIIHGVLHILGYTHDHDEDAEIMESLEEQLLTNVKRKYLD